MTIQVKFGYSLIRHPRSLVASTLVTVIEVTVLPGMLVALERFYSLVPICAMCSFADFCREFDALMDCFVLC